METLIFLHGGGVKPKDYQTLLDSLSKKYKVLAPDLYDLAETENFSWEKWAKNLDQLIGNKKVYLLGSSMGGGLALAYASFYPGKVKVAVVCEPIGAKIGRSKIKWVYVLQKATTRALFYPGGARIVFGARNSFSGVLFSNPRKFITLIKVLETDLESSLSRIEAPVCILWSQNSGVLPLWMGKRLDKRIKNSTLNQNFSEKNHLWCLFSQKEIAKEVKKILTDISTRGEREEKISNY